MTKILHLLPLFFLIAFIMFLATGVFIGIGYVFSLFLPLSVFQSSLLCMGATFVLGFILLGMAIYDYLFDISGKKPVYYPHGYYDEDDEFDEEFEDEEDEILETVVVDPFTEAKKKEVSRNAPCPCGSGKKFKICCGKVT